MIHRCKVECHKHDKITEEIIGNVPSVWLPFSFLLDTVVAIKEASVDPEDESFRCTTLYMDHERSFIIDTPYIKFEKLWIDFMTGELIDDTSDDNIEL